MHCIEFPCLMCVLYYGKNYQVHIQVLDRALQNKDINFERSKGRSACLIIKTNVHRGTTANGCHSLQKQKTKTSSATLAKMTATYPELNFRISESQRLSHLSQAQVALFSTINKS